MLDAYIIERIRREREQAERERERLRLPLPMVPPMPLPDDEPALEPLPERPPHDEREGGVVIVDFTI